MMNLQPISEVEPCRIAPNQPTPKPLSIPRPASLPDGDERWSGFREVLDLLRFDGQLRPNSRSNLFWRRHCRAGQPVVSMGQPFEGLYVVRFGCLKTVMTQVNGDESVLGFPMKGDLLGFDGVCKHKYLTDVIALTDCDLIKLPETGLFSSDRSCNEVERVAYWAISREIAQEQATVAATRSVRSEVRLARFLSNQSERFLALGYSPRRFTLPMSRRDIGSHLNITLETVSRAFSAMDHLGIIKVDRREVEILSFEALHQFGNALG